MKFRPYIKQELAGYTESIQGWLWNKGGTEQKHRAQLLRDICLCCPWVAKTLTALDPLPTENTIAAIKETTAEDRVEFGESGSGCKILTVHIVDRDGNNLDVPMKFYFKELQNEPNYYEFLAEK
jgi:hypothetical protein